ncbi:hypothetical protein DWB85_07570 [Seongchinamella sediminis]|uniref:Uncharacterized protein n=2 Tax=Seongchinamella sediminis TaxID=2283635 RepID=A0A3L7E160_9GAMM|nr:hypothetical protein DWB85_07570 [Seongchinamella sediminis]
MSPQASRVQATWDQLNFAASGDAQKEGMRDLVAECETLTAARADDAELLTWCGIANSTYAGMASALAAMKYAKVARKDLEHAIALDPQVLAGSALTSLGTLYAKVPGWPIGFGDDEKAEQLLLQGLEANPDGMAANFFYADFLMEKDQIAAAREHLEKALAAPPRTDRPLADRGRSLEIRALMTSLDQVAGE